MLEPQGVEKDKADLDFEDPLAVLNKGWGMFTSLAATGAKVALGTAEVVGKTVNENVLYNLFWLGN